MAATFVLLASVKESVSWDFSRRPKLWRVVFMSVLPDVPDHLFAYIDYWQPDASFENTLVRDLSHVEHASSVGFGGVQDLC